MLTRWLVIVLAFAAAAYRASQGAVVEACGLAGLGAGLLVLQQRPARPRATVTASLCFAVTAVSMAIVLVRDWL